MADNIKTVSSDNLTRFKQKCDETYAAIDNIPTVSTELVNLGTLSTSGTLTADQATQIGTTTVGVTARASVNSVTRFYERVNISGTTAMLISADDDALHILTVNLSTRAYTLSDVALGSGPEIPTPTTSDNGKILGVANGAYALQEASGGGGTELYIHVLCFEPSVGTVKIYLTLINDRAFKYPDFISAFCAVLDRIDGYNSPETYIYPATGYESEGQKIYGITGSYDSSDVEVNLIVYVDSGTKVSHNNLHSGWKVQDIVTKLNLYA